MLSPSPLLRPPSPSLWTLCRWDDHHRPGRSPSSKTEPDQTIFKYCMKLINNNLWLACMKTKSYERRICFPELSASSSFFLLALISRMDCRNSSRFTFPSWSRSVSFIQEGTYGWFLWAKGLPMDEYLSKLRPTLFNGQILSPKMIKHAKTKNTKKVSPKI